MYNFSDSIHFIMHQKDHEIIHYIDGLIGFGLPNQIHKSFQDLGVTCSWN